MITHSQLKAIARRHKRIAIVGGPKAGKSTMSRFFDDRPVHHNDSALHVPWDDQPDHWIKETEGQDSFVIEGVQAARAIRKGLKVDAVIHLSQDDAVRHLNDIRGEPLKPGQVSMHKGQATILQEALTKNPHIAVYRS